MKTLMRKVALILVLVCIFAMVLPVSAAEERIDLYKSGGGDGPKCSCCRRYCSQVYCAEGKMLKAFVFIDSPTWTKDSTGEIVLFNGIRIMQQLLQAIDLNPIPSCMRTTHSD